MRKILIKSVLLIKKDVGSASVIVALTMSLILIISALVIDLGLAYLSNTTAANAADASALAAGYYLPVLVNDSYTISKLKQSAILYASKNGIPNLKESDIILSDVKSGYYTKLQVNTSAVVKTNFARVIGVNSITVMKTAKVRISPSETVVGVVPFAIKRSVLNEITQLGMTNHVKLKFGGGEGETGSYGVLDLDGMKSGGANDVELWINYGYTAELTTGEKLYPIETGNMANPIYTAVQNRYNNCTHFTNDGGCNIQHFVNDCPRIVTVPVVTYVDSHQVTIDSFAAFVIEPSDNNQYVYGSFIKKVSAGKASRTIKMGDTLDYGLYSVIFDE